MHKNSTDVKKTIWRKGNEDEEIFEVKRRRRATALLLATVLAGASLPGVGTFTANAEEVVTVAYTDGSVCGAEGADRAEQVQAQINALPTLDGLQAMTAEEQQKEAYKKIQNAYEAYEALSEEEQAQITGADALEALLAYFTELAEPLQDDTGAFEVSGGTINTHYTYNKETKTLTVKAGANITIKTPNHSAGNQTEGRIVVEENADYVNITLSGVAIKSEGADRSALELKGNANVTLNGENYFTTSDHCVVIAEGKSLTIEGSGSMDAISTSGYAIYAKGSFTIKSGTVTATGANDKAGLTCSNKLNINGGIVTVTGGGLHVDKPEPEYLTMRNAVIIADKLQINGTVLDEDKKNWSGLVFDGDTGTIYGTTVTPTDSFTIPENHTLTIGQGQTLTISEGVTLANKGKIQGDGTIDNKGIIKNYGMMTGTVTGGGKVYGHFHNQGENNEIAFAKLPDNFTGGLLSEGSYYLDKEVDLDESIKVKGTVDLCLNGQSIESGNSVAIIILPNGSGKTDVDIYDDTDTGSISSDNVTVIIQRGTLCLHGGKISSKSTYYAVDVNSGDSDNQNKGYFEMNGGSISATQQGVHVEGDGTFTFNGGEISDCGQVGVGVQSDATFNMGGGKFRDNGKTQTGYRDVDVAASSVITLLENSFLSADLNPIYVSISGGDGTITNPTSKDYSQYFASADPAYEVKDFVTGTSHVLKLVPKDPAPAIMLGASGISGGQTDSIYFGNYQQSKATGDGYNTDPIKWRVLDAANNHKTSESGTTTTSLFLLSDKLLEVFQYHMENEEVTWKTSTMRSWLNGLNENKGNGDAAIDYKDDNFINTAFSEKERGAIANTNVVTWSSDSATDKIFLLSKDESENINYFPNGNSSRIGTNTAYVAAGGKTNSQWMGNDGNSRLWWLRDRGTNAYDAAYVNEYGEPKAPGSTVSDVNMAVRPAFNLDLDSVLFTSAAAENKPGSFSKAQSYTGNEWKLTLKDEKATISGTVKLQDSNQSEVTELTVGYANNDKSFVLSNVALSNADGYTNYTAALTNGNGEVVYYGSIGTGTTATEKIDLPANLPAGSYTLSVYGEQWNGDYMTDYATATPLTTTFTVKGSAPSTNSVTINYEKETISFDNALEVNAQENFDQATNIQSGNISNYISSSEVTVYVRTKDPVSEYATFTIPARPAAPTGLKAHNASAGTAQGGKITGLDRAKAYQYSKDSGGWIKVQANSTEITGLAEGTYYVRFAAGANSFASSADMLTVRKAERTITLPDAADVSANSVTLSTAKVSAGTGDGTVQYGYSTTNNANDVKNWQTVLTFDGLNAGTTYYFFARVVGGQNYQDATSGGKAIKTGKTSITVTVTAGNVTYDGDAKRGYSNISHLGWDSTLTVTYERNMGSATRPSWEVTTQKNSGAAEDGGMPVYAGSYRVTAKIPDNDPGCTGSGSAEFTIEKAARTITSPDAATVSANSVTLSTAKVSDGADDGTVQYGYSTTNNASDVKNWQTGLTFNKLKAGTTYYFFAKVAGGQNYQDATSGSKAIKTGKTSITVTVTAGKVTYDGNAKQGYSNISHMGWEGIPAVTYERNMGSAADPDWVQTTKENSGAAEDGGAPVYAGSYRVTAKIPDNDPGCIGSGSAEFQILPKEADIIWGDTEFTYDGNPKVPTATAGGLVGTDVCNITVSGEQTDAGNGYTATAVSLDNGNYKLPAGAAVAFSIKNASQEKPGLAKENETIKGRGDGKINGLDTTMEISTDGTSYTAVSEADIDRNYAAGTYYVRYAAKKNYDASEPTEVTIAEGRMLMITVPQDQTGYTLTADKTETAWNENVTFSFALKDGYSKTEAFAVKINGSPVELTDNKYGITAAQEDIAVTVEGIADITAPVFLDVEDGKTYCSAVEITVSESGLKQVMIDGNAVTVADGRFTVFPKQGVQTITAIDEAGNMVSISITVNDGHTFTNSYDAEWTSDKDRHWHECPVCGDKTDEADHAPKTVNAREATTSEKGYTGDTVCGVCGFELAKGKEIPMLLDSGTGSSDKDSSDKESSDTHVSDKENPPTGDNSNVALWMVLLSASSVVLIGFGKKKMAKSKK